VCGTQVTVVCRSAGLPAWDRASSSAPEVGTPAQKRIGRGIFIVFNEICEFLENKLQGLS